MAGSGYGLGDPLLRAVPYVRVSTEEQRDGHGPDRQLRGIESWAHSNRVEITEPILDIGTSGGITPAERPRVLEAVEAATVEGCTGLVVAESDRWTRGGIGDSHLSRAWLAQQHGLVVYYADLPFGIDQMLADIILAVKDAMAQDWLREHTRRVRDGCRDAKARGWPHGRPGRPAKAPLSPAELDIVLTRMEDGWGMVRIAHEVSRLRGAFAVATPSLRYERTVGETWLRNQVKRHAAQTPRVSAAWRQRETLNRRPKRRRSPDIEADAGEVA